MPNIWAFYSNKNARLLTVLGDVAFIQTILLELDPKVISYTVANDSCIDEGNHNFGRDLIVDFEGNARHWYFCGRHENVLTAPSPTTSCHIREKKKTAESIGAEFRIRTEIDFARRMIEFRNALLLSSTMTRCRDFSAENELTVLIGRLSSEETTSIRALLDLPRIDKALMLCAIARGISNGLIKVGLRDHALTIDHKLAMSDQTRDPKDRLVIRAAPIVEVVDSSIARNRRTNAIPEMYRDSNHWPAPNPNLVVDDGTYMRNKNAVDMYMAGRGFDAIARNTHIREDWVRHLFKKCLKPHSDGRIMGYRALLKYSRVKPYERHKIAPASNLHNAKRGGYAGALAQLFEQFPDELLDIVESHVLKIRAKFDKRIPEARSSWKSLRNDVIAFLKSKGLGDQYPCNTRDKGYSSLAKLGRSILFKRPVEFIRSRMGKDAGRLARQGKGIPSLIQATGPMQIVELDFHKHDSAAIVEVETPMGSLIPALVPRWWIGALIDTYDSGILGSTDSIEDQTTQECVMDLVDSAICPPAQVGALAALGVRDGCWLPNQIFPEFAFGGWDILRLDRAWAHKSTTFVASTIATTGCAVCFSAPRTWWARAIVERTFRELTARGAQRLLTTYGSGPADARRSQPEKQAISQRFRQDEMCDLAKAIIRNINEDRRSGAFYDSVMALCRRVETISTYFPRPLPLPRQTDRPTQWVTKEVKIEANAEKGEAPFVRVKHTRFKGPELADQWGLVGQSVFLQVHRLDIRIARVCKAYPSYETIGYVLPPSKWLGSAVSWRLFDLIETHGPLAENEDERLDPVTAFTRVKAVEVSNSKKAARDRKRAARDYGKAERETPQEHAQNAPEESDPSEDIQGNPSVTALANLLTRPPKIGSFGSKGSQDD